MASTNLIAPRTDDIREVSRFYDEICKRLNYFLQFHTVTVAAGASTGSSTANTWSVGGTALAPVPTGNQDQFIDNVEVNADGSVTVTLAGNATADNTFNVPVVTNW